MSNKIMQKPAFLIRPNPNPETYKEITEAVTKNGNYCCCALEKIPDTMCICKAFRDKTEGGFCHCGRFYKVKDYPIITIIHSLEDEEHAISLASCLTTKGFIVILPLYHDILHYTQNYEKYRELQKAKINKADLVFVVNSSENAMSFLEEEILWAEELHKKTIYEYTEEAKEDEI